MRPIRKRHAMSDSSSRLRFPAMALSIAALLAAIWAGLIRLGWRRPALQPSLPLAHGPFLVTGFLGIYPARLWGGLLNGLALLIFIGVTAGSVVRSGMQRSAGDVREQNSTLEFSNTIEHRKV
jgi:hypothetical protein